MGFKIHPVGFSSYEKSTIETFFRLAGRRAPHWELTSRSSEARVVLINAVNQQEIDVFRTLIASWQKVIIVGASDYGTGWPVLPRPIKLTVILAVLDTMAREATANKALSNTGRTVVDPSTKTSNKHSADANQHVQVQKPSMTDVFANILSKPVEVSAPIAELKETVEKTQLTQEPKLPINTVSLASAPSYSSAAKGEDSNIKNAPVNVDAGPLGRVLIVDDSDIALKFMNNRLQHHSYECDLVHSGEEALAMVAKQSYQFIFLDVMMEGLDGYKTCRAIKSNKARRGPAPIIVMLTSRGGTIDKIRGNMAGCDAYLTKPLNEKKLIGVLAQFDNTTRLQRYEATHVSAPLADMKVTN